MSKRKISGTELASRGALKLQDFHRFLGLSLAGGKTDKACLAVIEYFPKYKKIFLTKIFDKIKSDENISSDLKLYEFIEQMKSKTEYLAMDVPWDLPLCLQCELNCPGYENCSEPHIEWMWDHFREHSKKKKPKKIFTPYTQRSVEMYVATELEENFVLPHAMGSNRAPLLARARFLQRRLNLKTIEVHPSLSLWRIGRTLPILKTHLRSHRMSAGGAEARRSILKNFSEAEISFFYEQDVKLMIENNHAFEAYLCALTAFYKFKGQTVQRPANFPKQESWIEIPLAGGKS